MTYLASVLGYGPYYLTHLADCALYCYFEGTISSELMADDHQISLLYSWHWSTALTGSDLLPARQLVSLVGIPPDWRCCSLWLCAKTRHVALGCLCSWLWLPRLGLVGCGAHGSVAGRSVLLFFVGNHSLPKVLEVFDFYSRFDAKNRPPTWMN